MGSANKQIINKGLVLWGCGKMGSALLQGWLKDGIPATSIWVNDPQPNDWVKGVKGLHLNTPLPKSPMVCVIAVKPQMMDKVLTDLGKTGDADTIFLSIAAGVRICDFENAVNKNMGGNRAVIRAMPNTPAAIGAGISAVVCNKATSDTARDLADDLLSAVGAVIHLEGEEENGRGDGGFWLWSSLRVSSDRGDGGCGHSPRVARRYCLKSGTNNGCGRGCAGTGER